MWILGIILTVNFLIWYNFGNPDEEKLKEEYKKERILMYEKEKNQKEK